MSKMLYIAIALFLPLFYVVRARRKTSPFPPGAKKLQISLSGSSTLRCVGDTSSQRSSREAILNIFESTQYDHAGELMGWGNGFAFRPNDDTWKAQRKIVTQAMPPTDPKRFHSKQLSATHDLLRALPQSNDIMESLQTIGVAAIPTFYVDQIPILKYVSEWFPGASFKRKAREWNKLRVKLIDDPYLVTKARLAAGTATPSLTSLALEKIDHMLHSKKKSLKPRRGRAVNPLYRVDIFFKSLDQPLNQPTDRKSHVLPNKEGVK
ncbi:hypothetical protein BT96DRAFT_1083904 [Gymnopus androsaceus JB14]|uniref:Cytochrome P450 n=1 Tax=Gymnopus androsaceus JB14 TaxID=1447944 RepID=A0A6A4GLZ2_9AGAR|nr:hypothetical protein BT96DRAFT_1083904 [Gymnopus androsaceus JB14]